jgi:hypothetical protein
MAVLGAALMGVAGWLAVRNLRLPTSGGSVFWVPITLWLLTMGVLCWWFTISSDQAASRAAIRASWRAGWKVGAVGLAAGFIGPLLIHPKASLGPLLGILVTGPLGFVVGVLGASVLHLTRVPGEPKPRQP